MEELKDCPFCGGEGVMDGRSDDIRVRCSKCNAQGDIIFFDEDDFDDDLIESQAADAWNTRAK